MTGDALPELIGNRTIALSWVPGHVLPPAVDRLLSGFTASRDEGILLASERSDCIAREGPAAIALGIKFVLPSGHDQPASAISLLATLPSMPELGAPATALYRIQHRIVAWCDRYGIGQLFFHQASGIAAVSTSATLLARLFACEPDRVALTGFALTGSFVGSSSPFRGIEKVPLGKRLVIERGAIAFDDGPSPMDYRGSAESTLEEVTEAFVTAVRRMDRAFPEAELELSGGLDSRLILAALPQRSRRDKSAMTIGPAASGDAIVAAQLARKTGLRHRLISSAGFAELDADGLQALIGRVAEGYDHLANPLDKLAIVSAGFSDATESPARFGGQNGEILRGFYYTAQPLDRTPSEELARRLITWRLESNDRVSDELLTTPEFSEAAAQVHEAIIEMLLGRGDKEWWQALDRLYLTQRMPRWVGAGSTNRFIARTNLYPFLDSDFVDAAMRLPGSAKRNSQAAYRMLSRIDPELAVIPLDNGIVPDQQNRSFPKLTQKVKLVTKVFTRISNRVSGKSRSVLGSASAIDRWYGLSLSKRLPVKSLNAMRLANERAIENLANENRRFDRASLGWLLLIESLTRSEEWNSGSG